MSSLNRRQFGAVVVGSTTGIGALLATTQRSSASLSGELSVDDTTKDIQEPIDAATLDVSGSFEVTSDTAPDKIILRLEVKRDSTKQQLAADSFTSDLGTDVSKEIDLSANLFSHDKISAATLTPSGTSDTESVELEALLTIQVKHNGTMLAEQILSDTFTIETTKTNGETTISIGATGSVTLS